MKRRALLAGVLATAGVLLSGAAVRAEPVALDAGQAGQDGPRWVQVAAAGNFKGHSAGEFTLDREVFEQLIKNFRRHPAFKAGSDGRGSEGVIPFDFHHANEADARALAKDGAPAQGWVLDLEVRTGADGDQLWALAQWLEPARTYIREGRYKWTSIAIWPNARDQKSGADIGWYMSSIALTNDPFIQGMQPITAAYMHDPYTRASSVEELCESLVEIFDLPWSTTKAELSSELAKLEDAVRGRGDGVPKERIDAIVGSIAQCLNLPVLTDQEEVVRSAQKLVGQVTASRSAQAEEGIEEMDLLIKLAERLGVGTSVILAARKEDPKALATLEAEAFRALERSLLDGDTNGKAVKVLLESLGVVDETKASTRLVELLKAEEELKKLQPEIEQMRKDKAEAEAKAVENDVDAAIAASNLPKNTRPALLHFRKSDPVGFATAYPPAQKGMEHLTRDLTRSGEQRADTKQPAAPRTPAQLAGFPGRNDVERAISYVRSQPGGEQLSWDQVNARACDFVRSLT